MFIGIVRQEGRLEATHTVRTEQDARRWVQELLEAHLNCGWTADVSENGGKAILTKDGATTEVYYIVS